MMKEEVILLIAASCLLPLPPSCLGLMMSAESQDLRLAANVPHMQQQKLLQKGKA